MAGKLTSICKSQKKAIVDSWFDLVIRSYPPDTSRFLKGQKDPFANPVGQTTRKGLEAVFDEVLSGMDREALTEFLDPIIRIRAVQDFTPSKATAFILDLKPILRQHLRKHLADTEAAAEMRQIERNIDALLLIGFDIYVTCREKIYQLKVSTERDKIYRAFARAGLIKEDPEDQPDRNVS